MIRAACFTMAVMLVTIFAKQLALHGVPWLTSLGRLAWPWYVPMGLSITLVIANLSSLVRRSGRLP